MKLQVIDGKVLGMPENDRELEVLINLSSGATKKGRDGHNKGIQKHGLVPKRCIAEDREKIVIGQKGLAAHVRAYHKDLYTIANFPMMGSVHIPK